MCLTASVSFPQQVPEYIEMIVSKKTLNLLSMCGLHLRKVGEFSYVFSLAVGLHSDNFSIGYEG